MTGMADQLSVTTKNQGTNGPVSISWVHKICRIRTRLEIHDYKLYNLYPCRSIRKQIWPCHKNGQGQPSVIIWTNLVILKYPMLYTKIHGHHPLGSEEREFWWFLPYMSLEAILWLEVFEQIFIPISHGGSIWNVACFFRKRNLEMLN